MFTVDSYQGEENDIIILSLVRSNDDLGIGFLDSRNRLVVALSRARRGLYIFGNAITLTAAETSDTFIGRDVLWGPVIQFMKSQGRFYLDDGLPITCSKHATTISIMEADEWLGLAGGCDKECGGILPCGHDCPLKCHPFDHDMVLCRIACPKILSCGHGCSHFCGEVCECSHCEKIPEDIIIGEKIAPVPRPTAPAVRVNSKDTIPYSHVHLPLQQLEGRSRPGKPSEWQNWDANKADAEMAEMARQKAVENPGLDYSKIAIMDTWRAVSLENGERAISKPKRKLIGNPGEDNNSATQASSATSKPKSLAMNNKDEGLDNMTSEIHGLSLSNRDHRCESSASKSITIDGSDNDTQKLNRARESSPPFSNHHIFGESPAGYELHEVCANKHPIHRNLPRPEKVEPSAPMDESEDLIDLGDDTGFTPVVHSDAQKKTVASTAASDGDQKGKSDENQQPERSGKAWW